LPKLTVSIATVLLFPNLLYFIRNDLQHKPDPVMTLYDAGPDLKEELLRDFSKANTVRIAGMIGSDPKLFDRLILIALQDNALLAARAAWVLRHCYEMHRELIHQKHLRAFVVRLTKPSCDAVKRNITAILQHESVPLSCEGILVDQCFKFLSSGSEATAVKVHSMSILYNMAIKYPDLKSELCAAIQTQMPLGSAGFINRATRIIRALSRG
jgi:hypothetical protein